MNPLRIPNPKPSTFSVLGFHVELDRTKLAVWAASRDPKFLRQQEEHATVQGGAAMLAEAEHALPEQQRMADRIYGRWLAGAR